jgi:tetratricopeptide (TPR) repeat protein
MKNAFLLFCLFPALLLAQPKQKPTLLTEAQTLEFDKLFFNGLREKLINNNKEAEIAFKQALKINPYNANAWFQLSSVLLLEKQYNEAEEACRKAVSLDAKNIYYLTQLAGILRLNGNYKESALVQEKLVKLTNRVNDYFDLAETYYMGRNWKASINALNRAEKVGGFNENIFLQRKQIYLSVNKLKDAVAEMDKLIKINPSELRYSGMKADILMANGKNKEALAIYNDVLTKDSANGHAAFALADFYKLLNDTLNWYRYLKIGLAGNISVREKVEVMAQVIPSGKLPNHIAQCLYLTDLFIQANPSDAAPYMLKGDIYLQQRDFENARFYYRQAADIDGKSLLIWEQLLFSTAQLNNPELMVKDCKDLITYYPTYQQAYLFLAFAYQQLKQYNNAIDASYAGLALADNNEALVQFLSLLADAAHYNKNYSTCDSAYNAVIQIEPNNTYALNNWAYFLSLRKEKLDKAEQMSLKTITLEPDNASYLDTYGWILFVKGEYEQAEKYIEKSLSILPNNAEVLEHLGDVQFKLNKIDLAVATWQKALNLDSERKYLLEKIKQRKIIP